jgi:hypothetical protein
VRGEENMIAVLVTFEAIEGVGEVGKKLELRCVECVEGQVEAVYYLTPFTLDEIGGRNCQRCHRSVGAVAYKGPRVVTAASTPIRPRLVQPGTD